MFGDVSLCTWGRPGGCGLGFDLRARTRTGMCPKRHSFSDVLSDWCPVRRRKMFVCRARFSFRMGINRLGRRRATGPSTTVPGGITIITNKCNRRNAHGHHGSNRRELSQHAHSHGSQLFTHTLYIHQHSYNHVVRSASSAIACQCMLGLFGIPVSVIHRTLTWTSGS